MNNYSPNTFLDSFCIYTAVLIAIYNFFRMKRGKDGTGYIFFVITILLFSLFYRPEGCDFWGHLRLYLLGEDAYSLHMEPFFYWLIEVLPNNYLIWRTAIWLPAAILIAISYKKMNINSSYATVFFFVFALTQTFYYLRNILGFALLTFAITYLSIGKQNKYFKLLIFSCIVIASWFLHKSMPLYIFLVIIAILLPHDKRYLIAAAITIPIISSVILTISAEILQELNIEKGLGYLEADRVFTLNWKGIIGYIIQYAPIVYFYYIAFSKPLPKDNPNFTCYKVFLLYSFFIFCISFLFLGKGSFTLQLRFYYTSLFPFAFAVTLYFKEYLKTTRFETLLYLILFNYSWKLLNMTMS